MRKGETMNRLRFVAVCAFSIAVAASAASAQMGMGGMGMRPPMASGVFSPTVGAGVQYESTTADGNKTTVEFTVVGKETVNGKDGFWLEWWTPGKMGDMVFKTLVVPGVPDATQHVIMQMGKNPPMEMPTQSRGMSVKPNLDIRGTSQDVGKESVTVPAGTYSAEHYKSKEGGDTWISSQVPVFGMVKSSNSGTTMVLTKVLTGAKDRITGTPVPFNPQMMMQGMQNQ